ncbi:Cytochrome P450 89A9, partial [Linum perenne]
ISTALLIQFIFSLISSSFARGKASFPSSPAALPFIGNLLLLCSGLEQVLRSLHAKHGHVVTLHIGNCPAVFVTDRGIAHHALIQNGAVFSGRPSATALSRIYSSNQHNVSSASYGPMWRILRRNLTAEILHPSHVKIVLGLEPVQVM